MDSAIVYWLNNLDIIELKKKVGTRKIYIWGAFSNGRAIRKKLECLDVVVEAYVDAHKIADAYDGYPVLKPGDFLNSANSFLIISVIGVRNEIVRWLNKYNLKENMDYIYISKYTPHVILKYCMDGYEDCYGNQVHLATDGIECEIELKGFNNIITIGTDFRNGKGSRVLVENGANIEIMNDLEIKEAVRIEALDGGKVAIGNNCIIYKDSRICAKGASIQLGNYVTAGERFFCINGKKSPVEIGHDCMFSNDVSIISAGGHSIFDLDNRKNILNEAEQYINIGNHVWLGKGVTVLYNTTIGDGSLIGASSLVKAKIPSNCIAAGNPARVVKTKRAWDRRQGIEFEEI